MQINHRNAARAERPPGGRAHRQGRESTGNGGPGNRPSEGPISNRGRKTTPQAAASQGAQRVPRCSQQIGQKKAQMTTTFRNHFTFRVDTWTPEGESILEHVSGNRDYPVAV